MNLKNALKNNIFHFLKITKDDSDVYLYLKTTDLYANSKLLSSSSSVSGRLSRPFPHIVVDALVKCCESTEDSSLPQPFRMGKCYSLSWGLERSPKEDGI